MDKIKILFLAADPSDSARLRLGQEVRDIREKLQLSKQRDRFLLEPRESTRPGDIIQALLDLEPSVVHFAGHGLKTGELCFENILGSTQPVKPDALASLFELVTEQVSCVVLNACYSEAQANAISKHIPFVIGMNQAIGDRAAIIFATGFYKALGAGRSFQDAYKFACVEIQLEGIPEHSTPVFYSESKQAEPAKTQSRSSQDKAIVSAISGVFFREAKLELGGSFIRFFEDGIVISATIVTESTNIMDVWLNYISTWFNHEYKNRGEYYFADNVLKFHTTSPNGTVEYEGIYLVNKLTLNSFSHINGSSTTNNVYVRLTDS